MKPEHDIARTIDLRRMRTALSELETARLRLPRDAGRRGAEYRRELRAERSKLAAEIRGVKDEIIAWVITNVPVIDYELEEEEDT